MKLHVFPPSPRATKVMALANHLGLDCEIRVVNLFKGEQHQPGFAALNPNERMPVLEDDSFVLWESNAILQYLAAKKPGSGLWPSDAKGQADVLRWHSWDAGGLVPDLRNPDVRAAGQETHRPGRAGPRSNRQGRDPVPQIREGVERAFEGPQMARRPRTDDRGLAVGAPMATAEPTQYPMTNYSEITRWYGAIASLPAWQKALAAAAM